MQPEIMEIDKLKVLLCHQDTQGKETNQRYVHSSLLRTHCSSLSVLTLHYSLIFCA